MLNFLKTDPNTLCLQEDGFCGVLAEHFIVNVHPLLSALIAFSAGLIIFLKRDRVRNLTIASIVASGTGYALCFLAGFLIKLPYVFMGWNLFARYSQDKCIRFDFDKTRTQTFLLIFWGLALISMLYTFQAPYLNTRLGNMFLHGLPIRSLIQNLQLAFMLSFFYLTYQYCKDRESWRQISRCFTILTLVAVIYGVYELLTLYIPGVPYLNLALPSGMGGGYRTGSDADVLGGKLYRMHGFYNEPAGMACYLLFGIPLLAAEILTTKDKRPFKITVLLAAILALMLTTSNAAFVSAIAGYVAVLFFTRNRKPLILAAAVFLGISWGSQKLVSELASQESQSASVAATLKQNEILKNFNQSYQKTDSRFYFWLPSAVQKLLDKIVPAPESQRAAAEGDQKQNLVLENFNQTFRKPNFRYDFWRQAFGVFEKNPILGIGLGNYSFWFEGDSMATTTSLFIQVLVELGSVGMLVFLLFLGSIVWDLRRLTLSGDREVHIYALAMIAILVASLVDRMSFDALTSDPLLWVLLGMAAALPRIPREEVAR